MSRPHINIFLASRMARAHPLVRRVPVFKGLTTRKLIRLACGSQADPAFASPSLRAHGRFTREWQL